MPGKNREKNKGEVRIRGVSPKLIEELNNIADNVGTTLSAILKPKLREIANGFPEKMREPLKD